MRKRAPKIIPDEHSVYSRVHINFCPEGDKIPPSCIKNTPEGHDGMSCDWSHYSTPKQTRDRGKQSPENYRVADFSVGKVRTVPDQRVEHTPSLRNRAHSTIWGPKRDSEGGMNPVKYRVLLSRCGVMVPDSHLA